jgi:hypothetical protein
MNDLISIDKLSEVGVKRENKKGLDYTPVNGAALATLSRALACRKA